MKFPFAIHPFRRQGLVAAILMCAAVLTFAPAHVRADIAELKARQEKILQVVKKAVPATVAIQAGPGMGSGVIVSADGLVLTASHVSGEPGQEISIILSDGRVVKGKTLGGNRSVDAGMVQITDEGSWPFVPLGKSGELARGDWCVCTGHPGGVQVGRTAPVRVGRIVNTGHAMLISDCSLVGGDSGGPLFDLEGNVIGIHSSIGAAMSENRHVPIDRFRESWDRMAKGEIWGSLLSAARFQFPPGIDDKGGFLGVQLQQQDDGVTVMDVIPGSPAKRAGIEAGDVVTRLNGKPVDKVDDLVVRVAQKAPGTRVTIEVRRGGDAKKIQVVLGNRAD